jgi:hypothetical protein
MKQYRFLFVFAAMLALAALACNGGRTPTPVSQISPPTDAPQDINPTPDDIINTPAPSDNQQVDSSSGIVTFVDDNNLFSFDLPGDWTHSNSFNEDDGVYVDRFESPDGTSFIENITGFSKTTLSGSSNGKIALYFIHKYYSATGAEGDIRITSDQIQPDKSERLMWNSTSGGYSGISYFEVRGADRKTFLMLTVWWNDGTDQATIDIINQAIESYRVP